MYLQKVISKKLFKKLVFCWHQLNDENRRIRIPIRIHYHGSEAWIIGSRSGSGSTPKCHGSATLVNAPPPPERNLWLFKTMAAFQGINKPEGPTMHSIFIKLNLLPMHIPPMHMRYDLWSPNNSNCFLGISSGNNVLRQGREMKREGLSQNFLLLKRIMRQYWAKCNCFVFHFSLD
jgi:hypothetical protein